MANLDGKKVFVTGASRGIGKAIAVRLASEGAMVGLNYNASEQEARDVAAEIELLGGTSVLFKGDVSDSIEAQNLIQSVENQFNGLDILVNNAGITRDNLLMRLSEEDWDQVIDTNLKGAYLCTKAALRSMLRQRSGRIINMSSIVASTGNPGQSNYTAAKAGLIGFTKTMALEVASRGITVNAIAPGFIETQMVDAISKEIQTKILERIPLGYFGTPADVAGVVAFLVSEDARYITGQVIGIDGGLSL
ncbi:MAG: 3-oxoacyl-[acyl-carrier-protein] reductase [Chloroflexi bacterium]|nr:3-oxoacyl-[acyl-carrier-protein] reductase [Chloroflexota bacterium]|tara:strand:- start:19467 stop:20213 length:747 start_codon:yes stop_codon:yes gene_type:complete